MERYTESGRLALHSEHKRQEALEAQELFAGSPLMTAPGLDVDEPNQVDEPTVNSLLMCATQVLTTIGRVCGGWPAQEGDGLR